MPSEPPGKAPSRLRAPNPSALLAATRRLPLILAALLAAAGGTVVVVLSARADSSRQAQLELAHIQDAFDGLEAGAVNAATGISQGGGVASITQRYTQAVEGGLVSLRPAATKLRALPRVSAIATLERNIDAYVASQEAGLANLRMHPSSLEEAVAGHPSAASVAIAQRLALAGAATSEGFNRVNHAYSSAAEAARSEEIGGACAVIALLLLAFAFYFRRSRKLHERIETLLAKSRHEAVTDHLTGLGNRRAMDRDLATSLAQLRPGENILVALYDLDGFKSYNDTFGHQAGDALLTRLSANLRRAAEGIGTVYRMGGDEFCLLARCEPAAGESVARHAAASLAEAGERFSITASFGCCCLPTEASNTSEALRLADQRLYQQKRSRRSTVVGELTAALATAMAEHKADLEQQTTEISELARLTAEELGLGGDEVTRIGTAAKLYNIGKLGIPDSVLAKPDAALDEDERAFIRRHPLIGARIVSSAQSLADLAPIVRSSHERFDGSGYPEGLAGEQIPLGGRIIAVCEAYRHAARRGSVAVGEGRGDGALAEVRGKAGTKFDPEVVRALAAVLRRGIASSGSVLAHGSAAGQGLDPVPGC